MHLDSFKIALIGRTNVGKSTLFNRLVRSKQALTYDRPGVTRDTRERTIDIFDKKVILIDSPGMFDYAECDNKPELMNAINNKLNDIIHTSNLIVFVIDAIVGITPNDIKTADILRKSGHQVLLAVNKSEGRVRDQAFVEAVALGFEHTISVSAEHGQGIDKLLDTIYQLIPDTFIVSDEGDNAQGNKKPKLIKLAFVGRPNVGKSTLVNCLLGIDKQLVADFPGLTRESAAFDFEYKGKQFKIIDTPGIRRKAKIYDKLEKISVTSTLRSYRHADAVVLVVEATSLECGFIEKQDLILASNVLKDGKALIIAFNKYDQTPYKKNSQPKFLKYNFERSLSQHKDIPFLFISALNNDNIDQMMDTIILTYNKHKLKISTSKLNIWLQRINQTDTMLSGAVHFKLRYITQIGETPPTFLVFISKRKEMRLDQERFIINHFKQYFNLQDIVVKLIFKDQMSYKKNV